MEFLSSAEPSLFLYSLLMQNDSDESRISIPEPSHFDFMGMSQTRLLPLKIPGVFSAKDFSINVTLCVFGEFVSRNDDLFHQACQPTAEILNRYCAIPLEAPLPTISPPLIRCSKKNIYFEPVCPSCGAVLSYCPVQSEGEQKIQGCLICPQCSPQFHHHPVHHTPLTHCPDDGLSDWNVLVTRWKNLFGRLLDDNFPCLNCDFSASCYGPEAEAFNLLQPLSLAPFRWALLPMDKNETAEHVGSAVSAGFDSHHSPICPDQRVIADNGVKDDLTDEQVLTSIISLLSTIHDRWRQERISVQPDNPEEGEPLSFAETVLLDQATMSHVLADQTDETEPTELSQLQNSQVPPEPKLHDGLNATVIMGTERDVSPPHNESPGRGCDLAETRILSRYLAEENNVRTQPSLVARETTTQPIPGQPSIPSTLLATVILGHENKRINRSADQAAESGRIRATTNNAEQDASLLKTVILNSKMQGTDKK